jgi:sugar-phosphatase
MEGMTFASTSLPHPAAAFAERTFDAVLFDMDGTLVNSTPAVERAWRRWAAEERVTERDLAGSHGQPAAQIVARVLPPERFAAALERIVRYELTDVDDVVPLPGATEALAALPHGRAAIVTSCTGPLAAARIAAAGLDAPAHIVTIDDVEHGKPHPAPFREGARRLGFAPERCLVVEDAPAGLAAGRGAGCATLAVAGTHALDVLEADAGVPHLAHVRFELRAEGVAVVAAT